MIKLELFLCSFLSVQILGTKVNLALGKPTYTAPGTEHSGLNEGDHRSGCLHITSQGWWVVDLQSEYQISQVVVIRYYKCK